MHHTRVLLGRCQTTTSGSDANGRAQLADALDIRVSELFVRVHRLSGSRECGHHHRPLHINDVTGSASCDAFRDSHTICQSRHQLLPVHSLPERDGRAVSQL